MASERTTELRVGFFVFLGGAIALLTIFLIGGKQQMFQQKFTLQAKFAAVGGLRPGAIVQLAGLKVGTVGDIRLPENLEDHDITVVMKINRHYQSRVRSDSKAAINTQGLLGDKFINITIGSPSAAMLEEGATIATEESSSFADLAAKGGQVMDEVKKLSMSLQRITEQIEHGKGVAHAVLYDPKGGQLVSALTASAEDTREMLAGIKAGQGTLGRLIRDPTLYDDIKALFGRVNRSWLLRTVVRSTLQENEKQSLK
ncbi:MAG: MCE family protein [Deltaproteobacteria bacterium]|nr:MCE family protein [Deltaproteobacteria bacterium]